MGSVLSLLLMFESLTFFTRIKLINLGLDFFSLNVKDKQLIFCSESMDDFPSMKEPVGFKTNY